MALRQLKRALRRHRSHQAKTTGARAQPPELSHEEARQLEESLLARIAHGAVLCRQLEAQLRQHPAPEAETIIKLYRVLLLKLSAEVQAVPDLRHLVATLIKPVMDWARLEEKRKDREWLREKAAAGGQMSKTREKAHRDQALSLETLQKIERELKLF
jgi:hypothetical protein